MRTPDLSPREQYIESLYAKHDTGLESLCERLVADGRWGVNLGPGEARLLQVLIQMCGAQKVVEIGTLYGYSAVWMARALPPGGRLFTLERDPRAIEMARLAFDECAVSDRVSLCAGEASENLKRIVSDGPFDFVLIDANKSAYPDYLDWAELNVRGGGVIVADNTFLGGGVLSAVKPDSLSEKQWRGMRSFNERLADPKKFTSVILPTSEGLSIAIKK